MRNLEKGQHIFIAFQGGKAVLDSQLRPRIYTSLENADKWTPTVYKGKIEYVEYAPTLTPPNEAEKAIQRLGDFGKLFLDYSGCPRGPVGEPGGSTIEEWVTMMEPICDVDGGWWRPVPEKALQILLCEMRSLKQAVPPDHFPDSTKMVQDPPNEPLTPCDVCRFSPPSSGDGKPCCLCPADRRPSEGEEDT